MSPGEVLLALLRRWYVLVLAALLTAVGAGYELHRAPQYLSSAVIVLKPPVTGNQPNQLANLQPPLATVSYGIVQQLRSPAGTAEIAAAGVAEPYALVPRNSGTSVTPQYLIPSLQILARRGDPAAADSAVRTVISVYTAHVHALQDAQHIAAADRMSVDLLVPPAAQPVLGSKSRALAGIGLVGMTGGVLATLWADRLLTARSTRRRTPAARTTGDPAAAVGT